MRKKVKFCLDNYQKKRISNGSFFCCRKAFTGFTIQVIAQTINHHHYP
jgi:uncharacterized protein YegJ (DUF2314 family)